MKELMQPTANEWNKLRAFTRCVRAGIEGERLFKMGVKVINLYDASGHIIHKQADQQVIGAVERSSFAVWNELVYPVIYRDGKLVRTTNEDMARVLNEIVKIAKGEVKNERKPSQT